MHQCEICGVFSENVVLVWNFADEEVQSYCVDCLHSDLELQEQGWSFLPDYWEE